MSSVAIMQPYLLPYIGYWQLIYSVDEFVVYDNIEYTKKGWFNRNRILEIDHDRLFTVPLKKDSDYLPVSERYLSDDSDNEIARILRVIQANYKKAPLFAQAYPVMEECLLYPEKNLFAYIQNSIKIICRYLDIDTKIIVSSDVPTDHSSKGEDKVISICQALGATTYVNAIGGKELYSNERFKGQGINLKFIKTGDIAYEQFGKPFVPHLSIIDIMMFNTREEIAAMLHNYTLE
jgi:hypothetical protein